MVSAAAAAVVAAGIVAPGAPAGAGPAPNGVQRSLDALVRDDGVPAALASVTGRDGRTRTYTAGVADLDTRAEVPVDGQVRIGSNTKAFNAVVMLQLVGEGKVGLEAPIDTYLPGLLRGDGIDGRAITVHQLLQHTSGLPDFAEGLDLVATQRRYFEPRELLDLALARRADFAPGAKWAYSNTNYLVAGLVIQKVTGRPVGEAITQRVINRIALRHTSFPSPGDMTVHGPHPRGYFPEQAGGPLRDFTEMDPSSAWAAGAMVSTNTDLNRFYRALLAGRLLAPAQLAQMRTTVPADALGPGIRYGLGLESRPLSCGGVYWGHGGTIPGYRTRGGATEDGRAVDIAVTTVPAGAAAQHLEAAVDAALCR
ncbi:serine hydrolase [Kitasatospora aureofaciens]|uniref:serine hydrolase domain-containing protein n=1 Tax=Kitasatospora aureofaciens TaxID=1894 RepID=UPI001C47FCEC|nr:serine hydrolase domain-containing protein [Kitasatospora aureofaciens]MBV6700372.1 beta-lactamase family protein [Kitasatospora aureofaciens]